MGNYQQALEYSKKALKIDTELNDRVRLANDLLKYLSANMGLLHTKLDESIVLQHLIQHPGVIPNSMNYSGYIALGWSVLTNFGT